MVYRLPIPLVEAETHHFSSIVPTQVEERIMCAVFRIQQELSQDATQRRRRCPAIAPPENLG